jgi:D-psicose/D-tagatose/L-ribulose 3-epimerase
MRLGCCGEIEQVDELRAAGFAFLEINVQTVLRGEVPTAEWERAAPVLAKLPLPIEAANRLVPATLPLVGPRRDLPALRDYLERVAQRAQLLGLTRLGFGSGGARRRPEGLDPGLVQQHLVEFVSVAGDICARHGLDLVIEHLSAGDTNTLNKLSQARALCDQAAHPSVGLLVDSYHYALEKESDEAILSLGDRVRHVHVAEPVGRVQPGAHGPAGAGGPAYDFVHFFQLLRKTGYDGLISFECDWTGPIAEVAAASAAYVRRAWEQAGTAE